MYFQVRIDMSNASFAEPEYELQRILLNIQQRVGMGESEGSLRDTNGNSCGWFETILEELEDD